MGLVKVQLGHVPILGTYIDSWAIGPYMGSRFFKIQTSVKRAIVWSHYAVIGEYAYYAYFLSCVRMRPAGAAERVRRYSSCVTALTMV